MKIEDATSNLLGLMPEVANMASRNPKVALGLLPSALNGYILQQGKNEEHLSIRNNCPVYYNWNYDNDGKDGSEFQKIYSRGKQQQWDSDEMDWKTNVDPLDIEKAVLPEQLLPTWGQDIHPKDKKARAQILASSVSWMLSQFLHGEQAALHISCQTVEVNPMLDSKLYGSTQVVDEARHVEVFYRYLNEKLDRLYQIDDNLFTIIHYLSGSGDWDLKFLGMQIMIEGLALGAFGMMYKYSKEPLIKNILKGVIADEARHVHYGVIALRDYYTNELSESKRKEREDWAYEVAVMLRNRFLFLEIYHEYFAHKINRKEWDKMILNSEIMGTFRQQLFSRLLPNIKAVGLLSDRMRPRYEELGVLRFENEKSADKVTLDDLLKQQVA